VAEVIGKVEIERYSREQVADDVAQAETDDGDDDARSGDEAGCLLVEDKDENRNDRNCVKRGMDQLIAEPRRLRPARANRTPDCEIDEAAGEPGERQPADAAGEVKYKRR